MRGVLWPPDTCSLHSKHPGYLRWICCIWRLILQEILMFFSNIDMQLNSKPAGPFYFRLLPSNPICTHSTNDCTHYGPLQTRTRTLTSLRGTISLATLLMNDAVLRPLLAVMVTFECRILTTSLFLDRRSGPLIPRSFARMFRKHRRQRRPVVTRGGGSALMGAKRGERAKM